MDRFSNDVNCSPPTTKVQNLENMSFLGSPYSNSYKDYDDYEGEDDEETEEPHDESDEDTEDASETDTGRQHEPLEIKEQMYQDKLANLKKKLQQLKDGTHHEYNKKVKPVMTRKLRRRPNDPMPLPEKRRKAPAAQITYLLEEKDVENDLRIINKGNVPTPVRKQSENSSSSSPAHVQGISIQQVTEVPLIETKIEDGKLLYEKRWYHRGQSVFVEGRDMPKFPANISAIGNDAIWVKKSDGAKMPRHYRKKFGPRGKKNYYEKFLQRAVAAVKDKKISMKAAAERFAIPYSTINDHYHGRHPLKYGRPSALDENGEKMLAGGLQLWAFP
ncbi:unnamed protein product [Phaedon cochleariae]|uniref:HTH psq-type domain-containing protein n=1 Tax=Phaedon cochleariae TaxID=80249 RepID=A0A9N9X3G5_PHACE|nr:unnamed protein product [Phaedon cochleariae]